jgi:hypothetical protein
MISDDRHLDEARTPELVDGKVDGQRNQVGNQVGQGRRGCWARMSEGLALAGIDGGLYWLASRGGLKVDWRNVEQMDLGIGVGSVRYPYLSAYVALDERSVPDGLLGMCPAERSHDIFDPLHGKLWNPLTHSLDFQLVPDLD